MKNRTRATLFSDQVMTAQCTLSACSVLRDGAGLEPGIQTSESPTSEQQGSRYSVGASLGGHQDPVH